MKEGDNLSRNDLKQIVGCNIKNVRKSRNLTQTQLAEQIGKHESSIRKYEKGLTDIPNEVILKIADVLEVSPAELLSVDEWETKLNPDGKLSEEVKTIEDVKTFFGEDAVKLLQQFHMLNEAGKEKILSDLEDLTMLPKYQK